MGLCVAVNGELRKSNAKDPGSSEATKNWPAVARLFPSSSCFLSVSLSLAGKPEGVVMSSCAVVLPATHAQRNGIEDLTNPGIFLGENPRAAVADCRGQQ